VLGRHPIGGTIATSLLALIGAVTATVAVTPEFREAGGTDVILDAPHLGVVGRVLFLVIAIAAAGFIVWALARGSSDGGPPRRTIELTAVSLGVGVLVGLGYRIVTARSVGANIGGGLVLLASPVAALLFIGYVAVRLRGMRTSGTTVRPHR
jgi:hypothetical protein